MAGAALLRGRAERESRTSMGQGGIAVARALGAGRSRRTAWPSASEIATLPGTPALRRNQIKLQIALITPLIHVKGYAAPETKAAVERARLLIDQAETLGEPLEDPLLLFSVLYGSYVCKYISFNGNAMRKLACSTVPGAGQEAGNDGSPSDRGPYHGYFPTLHRRCCALPGAFRSSDRPL